jgi:hypothetical protein
VSDFAEAFAEVKRAVQPDVDPKLSYGSGETPDADSELDAIILASARAKVWETGLEVKYGERVVPTVGNGRWYRVTKAGALGDTEPTSWPEYDYGSVESGTVMLQEDGRFVGSLYDVRAAKYAAWDVRVARASNDNQYLNDARGQASSFTYLNCVRERDKYKPVGIA